MRRGSRTFLLHGRLLGLGLRDVRVRAVQHLAGPGVCVKCVRDREVIEYVVIDSLRRPADSKEGSQPGALLLHALLLERLPRGVA